MIRKLRLKFVCINMIIVTVMLLTIFGLVLHFTAEHLEQQSLDALQSIASGSLRTPDGPPWAHLPYFTVSVNVWGEVTVTGSGISALPDSETLEQVIALAVDRGDASGFLKSYALRYHRSVSRLGQSLVFVDVSSEISTLEGLVRNCILIGIASLSAFLGLSILLARWAIRPVEQAWNQQRQFVADASHELKTPLTVILTNAELLQSPDYTPQERSQFVGSILAMSHQMRGLVESLLELARVDNGAAKLVFSELDYSELVQECLLPFEPVYFERGLTLDSRIDPGIRLRGSAAHLRQVVEILLDNAAKYSTSGGQIWVRCCRSGSHCLLQVHNPGDPIPPEELKNIFKRFYRIDKARAMNHSYGLGLSIADSIVSLHGGKIWAESRNGINTFTVQLTPLP